MKRRGPSDISTDPNQPAQVKRHAVKVNCQETALNALKKMNIHHVSALAVVDPNGKMVGALSESHLRGMSTERMQDLFLSVDKFLSLVNRLHPMLISSTIEVGPTEKLGKAIKQALDCHAHRVWIVENMAPTRVVALSDMLSFFLPTI